MDLQCLSNDPRTPGAPLGPDLTRVGKRTSYYVTTTVRGNDDLQYIVDWGDESFDTTYEYWSGDTVRVRHTWGRIGVFEVRARAFVPYEPERISEWSDAVSVDVFGSPGSEAPRVTSFRFAIRGSWVKVYATAVDANEDSVSIRFDMGSGVRAWSELVPGETTVVDSEHFVGPDTLDLRCQARDGHGYESEWTAAISVQVGVPGAVTWMWWAGSGEPRPAMGSPVVVDWQEGTAVLVGSELGTVHRLDEFGEEVGSSHLIGPADAFAGHPAYSAATGHVYIAARDGWLHALTPEPVHAWRLAVGDVIQCTPAVDGEYVYVAADSAGTPQIRCVVDSGGGGHVVRARDLPLRVVDAPVVDEDGNVILVTGESAVYKFSAGLEELLYRVDPATGGALHGPVLDSDGVAFVCSEAGAVYALDENGRTRWTTQLTGAAWFPVVGDSLLFVGTGYGRVYALGRTDGSIRWSRRLSEGRFTTSPVLAEYGFLYCQDTYDELFCLRQSDGSIVWRCDCPSYLTDDRRFPPARDDLLNSSPCILPSGCLLVVGEQALYSVTGSGPALDSAAPWPKWQRDYHSSGRVR